MVNTRKYSTAREQASALLEAHAESLWAIADMEAKDMGFREVSRFDALWEQYKKETRSWRWTSPENAVAYTILTKRLIPAAVHPLVDFCVQNRLDPTELEVKERREEEVSIHEAAWLLRDAVIRRMDERRTGKKVTDEKTENPAL